MRSPSERQKLLTFRGKFAEKKDGVQFCGLTVWQPSSLGVAPLLECMNNVITRKPNGYHKLRLDNVL